MWSFWITPLLQKIIRVVRSLNEEHVSRLRHSVWGVYFNCRGEKHKTSRVKREKKKRKSHRTFAPLEESFRFQRLITLLIILFLEKNHRKPSLLLFRLLSFSPAIAGDKWTRTNVGGIRGDPCPEVPRQLCEGYQQRGAQDQRLARYSVILLVLGAWSPFYLFVREIDAVVCLWRRKHLFFLSFLRALSVYVMVDCGTTCSEVDWAV